MTLIVLSNWGYWRYRILYYYIAILLYYYTEYYTEYYTIIKEYLCILL